MACQTAWNANDCYRNANFAIFRVLIPRVATGLPPSVSWSEAAYAAAYVDYVNKVVFQPLGLPVLFCKPTDAQPALSYKSATANPLDFSAVQPGDAWGDMTLICGSQGWFLSALQLARFAQGLFQTAKILPQAALQRMKERGFGMNRIDHGGGLESWSHGGFHPAEMNKGEINTLVVSFNNGVSIGLVINSKFNGNYVEETFNAVKTVR